MCVRTNFVAYRAPGDFIPKEVRAEGCVEEVCPPGNILVSRTLGKDDQGNTEKSNILLCIRKNSGSLDHVDATTDDGSDSCGTTMLVERSTGARDLRFETAKQQTRCREVVG